MQRRTVQDPQHASSAVGLGAVRGTVAKLGLALATAGAALLAGGPAGGAPARGEPLAGAGAVAVVEVDGLVDQVLADFVADQVAAAEDECAVALVLQLDSGGVTVGDGTLD